MFDAAFLHKIEYLSLVSRRQFRGTYQARKRSKHLGGGIEFADHQNYIFGDDLRYLDWNIYARFGTELIKRFTEDRDLPVYVFLDCSKSMAFGTPVKFDYARQIAAALSYIALSDYDRVGIITFADKVYDFFPPIRGKQHILRLCRYLESLPVVGTDTSLTAAMHEFVNRNLYRGLAVVISDFYDTSGFQTGIDKLRYRGFEPYLIQIHDTAESEPDFRGDAALIDSETGHKETVTVNETVLRQYKKKFAEFTDGIRRYALRCGINFVVSSTNISPEALIKRMLCSSILKPL